MSGISATGRCAKGAGTAWAQRGTLRTLNDQHDHAPSAAVPHATRPLGRGGGGAEDELIEVTIRVPRSSLSNGAGDLLARAKAADLADFLYRSRRARDAVFGPSLFQEPAWDMMLDLYVATARGKETCISSACFASQAPATTALRHLRLLEEMGYVDRVPDPNDRRRFLVSLSARATALMTSLLADSS